MTAILFSLAFPKTDVGLLAWFALAPFLAAVGRLTPPSAAALGFLAGAMAWALLARWMIEIAWVAYLCLVLYEAVWWMLFANLWVRWGGPLARALTGPLLWVGLEWLRSLTPLGFSWGALGLTQHGNLYLLQCASLGGVSLLSYTVVTASFALWYLNAVPGTQWRDRLIASSPVLLAPVLALVGLLLLRGERVAETSEPVTLAQCSIDLESKTLQPWEDSFHQHITESWDGVDLGATLVVWPETASIYPVSANPAVQAMAELFVVDSGADLLFGTVEADDIGGDLTIYNSACFIPRSLLPAEATGYLSLTEPRVSFERVPRYDKMLLVPFGEFVPGERFLPFVKRVVTSHQGGAFTPGRERVLFDWRGRRFGVLICFESTFAWHARAYVKGGAEFLVNVTNDGLFGRSALSEQHLVHSVFRAVENGVPLVRSANSGISAFVDSRGRVRQSLPIWEVGQLTDRLGFERRRTFYSRYGDVFAAACVAIWLIAAVAFRRRDGGDEKAA